MFHTSDISKMLVCEEICEEIVHSLKPQPQIFCEEKRWPHKHFTRTL
ncbi:hypothetical protein CASFOL_011803 [Castilleja foliolosa]|uniref:Uncharacterized protein n=1 Tax=Castilleja foliolosa TaxID=1961234 RepID=A0ABD3DSQ0_9LAMI